MIKKGRRSPPEEHLFEESVGGAESHRAARVESVQLKLGRDHLSHHLSVGSSASATTTIGDNTGGHNE